MISSTRKRIARRGLGPTGEAPVPCHNYRPATLDHEGYPITMRPLPCRCGFPKHRCTPKPDPQEAP